MVRERVWIGTLAAGHESEHEQFVEWLASDGGEKMFRQYRLNGYALRQAENELVITMWAADPPIIIHFLRNPRAWPAFWEFKSNTPSDAPVDPELRVHWQDGH
jgi:hypothetical protein